VALLAALTSSIAVTTVETSAFAQGRPEPTPAERDTARDLVHDGIAKRDRGDMAGAAVAFADADALMKVPTTGLELAKAQVALGLLVEAEDVLTRVTNDTLRPADPPAFTQAKKAAEALRAEVMVRTPLLSVLVENAGPNADVKITVDGKPLEPPTGSHRINPGTHVIVARSGALSVTEKVEIAEGEGRSVKLDFSRAETVPPPPDSVKKKPSAELSVNGAAMPRVLFYGGVGLAVIGTGLGTGTGLVSLSHTESARKLCSGNSCPTAAHDNLETARTTATVSTVSFVAAGVGVASLVAGLVLMRREGEQSRAAFVAPFVSPFGAGVHGAF
jgi:hypothetical protein